MVDPNGGLYWGSDQPSQISPEPDGLMRWLTTGNSYFYGIGGPATRTGYNLDGYFDEPVGGIKVYNPNGRCVESKYWHSDMENLQNCYFKGLESDDNVFTVYAHWTAMTFTVTLDAQGGQPAAQTKQVTYGQPVGELPEATRAGHTFGGWENHDPNFYGAHLVPTTVYNLLHDATYYAVWTANTYIVTYNANGGEVEPDTKEVVFNEAYGEHPTPTLEGHSHDGWFTAAIGGTQVIDTTTVTTPNNHTLYAHWTINQYTATFDSNGGEGGISTTQDYGTQLVAPEVTRVGCTFD